MWHRVEPRFRQPGLQPRSQERVTSERLLDYSYSAYQKVALTWINQRLVSYTDAFWQVYCSANCFVTMQLVEQEQWNCCFFLKWYFTAIFLSKWFYIFSADKERLQKF